MECIINTSLHIATALHEISCNYFCSYKNVFCFVPKLVVMEIVHDGDCKAAVMAIITEVCPSAMEMEDIFISCDPDKTSRDIELFFNVAQQNLTP